MTNEGRESTAAGGASRPFLMAADHHRRPSPPLSKLCPTQPLAPLAPPSQPSTLSSKRAPGLELAQALTLHQLKLDGFRVSR